MKALAAEAGAPWGDGVVMARSYTIYICINYILCIYIYCIYVNICIHIYALSETIVLLKNS